MPTKKQRDRKRATSPKTKGLNIIPKKAKPKAPAKRKTKPNYDADVPDDAA